jgi:exportin-T
MLRVCLLFFRYVFSLFRLIEIFKKELLIVPRRPIQTAEDISRTGDFDSQLFIFVAVGYLISLETIPPDRQEGLLTIVIMPILRRIEEIVQYSQNAALDLVTIAELGDLISSIGCIAKGFPDIEKTEGVMNPFWTVPFKTTLQGILIVLSNLSNYPSIRSAARFTFQRMAGCMGPSLLEYIPAFLSSGLLSSETANELIDFLPFIGLTIYKLQVLIFLGA